MLTSRTAFLEQGIRVLWAPASLVTAVGLGLLGVRWYRASLHLQTPDRVEAHLSVLILYSALANLRSFLHPLGTLHFHYVHTLFPVLLYALVQLVPRAMERWGRSPVRPGRTMPVLVGLLGLYALAGLDWDLAHLAQIDTLLASPRGRAYYFADSYRRQPWAALLQYIESHTQPGDSIVILGPEPGFYFWTGRANPLRQDIILPGMSASRADAEEIVRRIQADCPALVIVPRSVAQGNVWLWNLEVGRKAYHDLEPVWQYIRGHYLLRTVVGGQEWGFSIYAPGSCPSRPASSSRNGLMPDPGLQASRRLAPVRHMSVKAPVSGV
jgi:hypothetical protein